MPGRSLVWICTCVLLVACANSNDNAPIDASGGAIDAGVDGPPPDAGATPFGEPCSRHADCGDGWCVETAGGGGVCSRECNDDCPDGWDCRLVSIPGENIMLCVPALASLCLRCAGDGECANGACLDLDGEGRCAADCNDPGDCPGGYECATDATGTHAGTFCQPISRSCTCNSANDGMTRTCSNMNASGQCWGVETCDDVTGWSACDADVPAPETCDGDDNDCNFVIDDGVGGGAACTNDNGFGSCPGLTQCDGAGGFICAGPLPEMEACNFDDDDCDSTVDEGFAGLGELCTDGIGACLAYGATTCTGDGTGTQCSAVAGSPTAEECNLIDDDCNGATDEDFTTLGDLCTVGAGICMRQGTVVCRADGTGAECSATAGPPDPVDTCNYLDDDCDGLVDDGFLNPGTGFYDQDTACGSCSIDCTAIYDGPNAFGQCVVTSQALCAMGCDAGAFDLNLSTLDGCEFVLDTGTIYVADSDPLSVDNAGCGLGPSATGGGRYPCKTITQGLARAVITGRANVAVADGTYDEAVTLVDGKNLLGGYRNDTWERHLATTATVIQGISASGNHDRTVIASGIISPTVFEGFVVRGSNNSKAGGNSYAIYVSGSDADLAIRNNSIYSGRGGPGAAGSVGGNGTAGVNGTGRASNPAIYDAKVATGSGFCNDSNDRQHTNGGVRSCGSDNVGGGSGGGNLCPIDDPWVPAPGNINPDNVRVSGVSGFVGNAGAGGSGGAAGSPGLAGMDGVIDFGGALCRVPSEPMFGADGTNGGVGGNAAGVAGCSSSAGSVSAGHWVGGSGTVGAVASNGGGGAGGGGGGGGYCWDCPEVKDYLGGHGGGGASGGCGGAGGGAGSPGGGVFGIFVTGGTAPTITNNVIVRGDGGDGGGGGSGGAGGLGGVGGDGGLSTLLCAGEGGRGGDGGNGGNGSGGGGGCGGSSYGIYTSGVGTPTYCSGAGNTISGGSGGTAGAGGFSGGNPGGSGTAGLLTTCSFN